MLNRNNLEIAALASIEESRYSLSSILIAKDRTAVTDGHLIATVTTPNIPAESVPMIEGFIPTEEFQPFMLPAKDAREIAKAIPRRSTIAVLANTFVDAGANGTARFAVTNLDTSRVFDVRKPAGSFPNIDMCIPKPEEAEIAIGLNPHLLVALIKALAPISDEKLPAMVLRVKDHQTQIRIDVENPDTGQKGIGILMPMTVAGCYGVRPRHVTIELLDGRPRNVWSDRPVEIQFINRKNGAEIASAELWTGKDISKTHTIPDEILAFLAPPAAEGKERDGTLTVTKVSAETPVEVPAPRPAAVAIPVATPAACAPPEASAGSAEVPSVLPAPVLAVFKRLRAKKDAAAAVAIPVATPAACAPPETPKVPAEVPAVAPAVAKAAQARKVPAPGAAPIAKRAHTPQSPEGRAKTNAAVKAYWDRRRAAKTA